MAQTFLIFDFGTNEEAAQRARHSIEGWRQGFRLDRKLLLKFDRQESADTGAQGAAEGGEERPAETAGKAADGHGHILLMVRLDFSDHEKLSHHRWLERLPAEAAFKEAQAKVIRHGDAEFAKTAEKFEALK